MPKVAVILSGCGVFDGSEIHEAVSTLLVQRISEVFTGVSQLVTDVLKMIS